MLNISVTKLAIDEFETRLVARIEAHACISATCSIACNVTR
jgi:hypothetical protein